MITRRRLISRFCNARTYVTKFSELQAEVNRLQIDVIHKKEELRKIEEMTHLSTLQYWKKQFMKIMNMQYYYRCVDREKDQMKKMVEHLKELEQEAKIRAGTSAKLKKEEQQKVELVFLSDLARFSLKYYQFLKNNKLEGDLHTGIEMSHQSLDKVLSTQNVEWIGEKNQSFDPEKHLRVAGDSQMVKQVVQRGFKVRSKVIQKAKVQLH